jgi:hypothetical protein
VVVYLRALYYPNGFAFPVVIAETRMAVTELFRELATLIIIWAAASLAYERLQSRAAAFFMIFGIWDIFYYIFLKILLDWPESLSTWDLLFLLPLPWAGPVWAPVLVSIGIIYAGAVVLLHNAEGKPLYFGKRFVIAETVSAAIIILSFLIPGYSVVTETIPVHFPWYLFWAGFVMGVTLFLHQLRAGRR